MEKANSPQSLTKEQESSIKMLGKALVELDKACRERKINFPSEEIPESLQRYPTNFDLLLSLSILNHFARSPFRDQSATIFSDIFGLTWGQILKDDGVLSPGYH